MGSIRRCRKVIKASGGRIMYSRVKFDRILEKSAVVTTLICIFLLIGYAQAQGTARVELEILGGTNDPNPVFKTNQEIDMKWNVQLSNNYESYGISVFKQDSEKSVRDYKGILSSIKENSGSINISGLKSGNYQALLTAYPKPTDQKSLPVTLPANFNVVNNTYIRIIKYIDENVNGNRDPGERGLAGWKFKIGRVGESVTEWRTDTKEDGSIVITDPDAGNYIIEEILQEGWFSTNVQTKRVSVESEKATTIEFGNIPAGSLKITSFADLNGNKAMDGTDYPVSGWDYKVTGTDFNQSVRTGPNGTVSLAVKPGQYTVSRFPKDCWINTGDASQIVEVKQLETKSISFGNMPQASVTIWAYQDANKNGRIDSGEGIPGVNFTLAGPQDTARLTSEHDGSASQTGIPGVYTVTANIPEDWDLKNPAKMTETLAFCDHKQMIFEVISRPINISDLVPENNDVIGSTDVSILWKTPENSSGKLYIKQENESNYSMIRGIDGKDHSINVTNLTRNANYIFYIRSEKGSRSGESDKRSFQISNGISFAKKTYEFNIKRDYDQHCSVSVINSDSKPHRIQVNISDNDTKDIYLGFLGEGSADRELNLAPGETKKLDLAIHAQDAMLNRYAFIAKLSDLGPEKIVDYSRININVQHPQTDFSFEEISTDPISLTKTFSVKNLKDTITDLSITSNYDLRRDAVIQPSISHAYLGTGESITFSVSPIWSKDVESVGGLLTASAGTLKKDLNVNFSCEKGRQLYEVTLPRPLLHFDTNVYQCINAHSPIIGELLLPPGLNAGNVTSGKIVMDLDAKDGLQTPYDVWVTINGKEIKRISDDVVSANYMFDINPRYLSYSSAGSAVNSYSINDTMPSQYRTYLSNVSILMCLEELRLKICAENQQQAEEIAGRIPWIYIPSNALNITILEPKRGENLTFGIETTIKAKVNGTNGGEKYSYVWGKSDKSILTWRLIDKGQNEDGIYASTWTPDVIGASSITVTASNCANKGSSSVSVMVNEQKNDTSMVPDQGGDSYIGVFKDYKPQLLDASMMDKENGNAIKYTIKIVPIGGIKLKDVKVVENLPNYITLNNSSVGDRGKIQKNNDGRKWSTTNVTWNIGDMDKSRSLSFEGAFHWRLPADAQHIEGSPLAMSVVTFRDSNGSKMTQLIPEGEIVIVSNH
jgi:hypothetical protein